MRFFRTASVTLLASMSSVVHAQIPESFEVVQLANDLGIHSRPAINNNSEVVWSSAFPPDEADVWLYSNGVIRKISDDTGYDVEPGLNDGTLVPWRRCESFFDTSCDLVVYENGVITPIEAPDSIEQVPDVNLSGDIVWSHDFSEAFEHVEVFRSSQGTSEQVTMNGLANNLPRINRYGAMVWIRFDFFVSPWTSTAMFLLPGAEEALELTNGTGSPQGIDINDLGQVTWSQYEGTDFVIKRWQEGDEATIAVGTFPRINNGDSIGFARWDPNSETRYQMLLKDGAIHQLPSTIGWWSAKGDINDLDELTWREIDPVIGDTRIMMMRRVAPAFDFNHDCRVDARDFAQLQRCFTGANLGSPGGLLGDCTRGDFDSDDDVDLDDYGAFVEALTGPDTTVPDCGP